MLSNSPSYDKNKLTNPYLGGNLIDTITNHINLGILIEDESGLVVSVNKEFCNIFNIDTPIEKLIGTDLLLNSSIDLTVLENQYYFIQRTNEILSDRVQINNDAIELKNGNYLERDYMPILDGNIYQGHIWYYKNATEKILVEKKLEKIKKAYSELFNHLPNDIAVLDPEYSDLFLNPIAVKDTELRKYILEWMINQNNPVQGNSIISNKTINNYQDLFTQVVANKAEGTIEEKQVNEIGETRVYLRNIKPILDETGKLNMIIGSNTDITERVKTEEKLKKAKLLTEEIAKAKELFLANISHEIRTPLNGILGVVNLINKTELTQQQRKMALMINEAANNLLVIVNDILNLEKISSGEIAFEEIPFSLENQIQTIVESFQYKAEEKKLLLKFENEIEKNQLVLGDPYRISQILNNLISNAIKFSEKGCVAIKLSCISETENLIWCKLAVKDAGIGIEANQIDQIFEPFKQADSSITRRYGGTGLGLGICKKLIENMGGRIAVESTPQKGSTFSCILPIKKNIKVFTPAVIKPNYEKLKGCRILLAEDVEMNQFITRSLLEEKGVYVSVAMNGKEAVEKVTNYQYDLILMDISMPYIDGIQATSIIRSMSDLTKKNIPIIAMTANAFKKDEIKYRANGMNGYLSKPFHEEQLLTAILEVLDNMPFVIHDDQIENAVTLNHKLYNEDLIMGMGKGKQEFIQKMVGLFLKTMPTDMELLVKSASKNEWKTVEKTAHRMKSALRGMGIKAIASKVKLIEEMAMADQFDQSIHTYIREVNETLKQVLTQLKDDYPNTFVPK
ncbi:PAS domain-containing hybrid sensor histidine kinase/response regulator [Sediminibacterium sp.]|uniref:PAS domain-containing hybrid sensor histidine kinase/response regulator n=1 Tax=Sediminibacterium sp. TaxID=1917865 RepID=UPI0027331974|nr:PAS domain-containing hybrid sensor histidine kinase/response regulator [Sediminibacterium sp.]MDP3392800.1 ATP-binding protein [Sediminibacterium sp.]MDP3565922.1 ATP-binding protein [Sediminibacterium sp.]